MTIRGSSSLWVLLAAACSIVTGVDRSRIENTAQGGNNSGTSGDAAGRGGEANGDAADSGGSSRQASAGASGQDSEISEVDSDRAIAIDCGPTHDCAVLESGEVACWGDNSFRKLGGETLGQPSRIPIQAKGVAHAASVSVGRHHTCALQRDGGVMCWGLNNPGQLGAGILDEVLEPVAVQGLPARRRLPEGAPFGPGRGLHRLQHETCAVRLG